jgi:hypothetical protein
VAGGIVSVSNHSGRQYREKGAGGQDCFIFSSLAWRVNGGDNTAMASSRSCISIDGCQPSERRAGVADGDCLLLAFFLSGFDEFQKVVGSEPLGSEHSSR